MSESGKNGDVKNSVKMSVWYLFERECVHGKERAHFGEKERERERQLEADEGFKHDSDFSL